MSMFDGNSSPQTPGPFHNAPPGYSNAPSGTRDLLPSEKPWRARSLLWVGLVVLAIIAVTYLL